MDKERFAEWATQQLEAAGMTQKQLAIALNTSESHVSLVLSGNRSLTADFAISVADILHADPVVALRIADILPPVPGQTDNPALAAAWGMLQQLSPDVLAVVVKMLKGVVR